MGIRAKTSEETIAKMIELYEELGTYAAVARIVHKSPTTVSKYVKLHKLEQARAEKQKNIKYKSNIKTKPIEEIVLDKPKTKEQWIEYFTLTPKEEKEIAKLREEII